MSEKNMKNIRKEFAKNGIFYTQKEDAERMKSYVDIEYDEVYDPTCGQGNLLSVFRDDVKKYGQELDAEELEKARKALVNFVGYAGDTLKDDKFRGRKFKLIIANPPFSVHWDPDDKDERFSGCETAPASKADWAFNLHIISHLKDDGEAVVLNYPGTAYRGGREQKIRRFVIQSNYIDRVVEFPGNTFVDTKISTVLYVFRKNRAGTDVIFVNRDGESRTVSREEIEKEGFDLQPGRYVESKEERHEVDINELNDSVRKLFAEEVKKKLLFDLEICEMQGNLDDHIGLIAELKKVIEEHERQRT